VRAKVSAIRAEQGDPGAGAQAVALLAMAAQHLDTGRVRLVLVGGLPGTGKTTLAAGLGEQLDATILRTDEIRKEGAGGPGATSAGSGAYREGRYAQAATDAVYDTMLARAATALAMGESVILDASWSAARHRAAARALAELHHADLTELRCDAPATVAAARIEQRRAAGRDASDATVVVAAAMAADADPWPEAEVVDTARRAPECSVRGALSTLRS
jgi:predicted kinase